MKLKELVKEIMQCGLDVAMGGDIFKSEEENKKWQVKEYDKMVDKYVEALTKYTEGVLKSGSPEIQELLWNYTRWLVKEGYADSDPISEEPYAVDEYIKSVDKTDNSSPKK